MINICAVSAKIPGRYCTKSCTSEKKNFRFIFLWTWVWYVLKFFFLTCTAFCAVPARNFWGDSTDVTLSINSCGQSYHPRYFNIYGKLEGYLFLVWADFGCLVPILEAFLQAAHHEQTLRLHHNSRWLHVSPNNMFLAQNLNILF